MLAFSIPSSRGNSHSGLPVIGWLLTEFIRRNPAVTAAANQIFIYICQALEAETVQGQVALHVAASAKKLVQFGGLDVNQLLSTQTPELQQTVRSFLQ